MDGSSPSCSTKARIWKSVRSAYVPCTRLGRRRRTCPGKSKMLFSSEIRFSGGTMAPRAVTFLANPPTSFTIPSSGSMRCHYSNHKELVYQNFRYRRLASWLHGYNNIKDNVLWILTYNSSGSYHWAFLPAATVLSLAPAVDLFSSRRCYSSIPEKRRKRSRAFRWLWFSLTRFPGRSPTLDPIESTSNRA
jgi:hypothetical protein